MIALRQHAAAAQFRGLVAAALCVLASPAVAQPRPPVGSPLPGIAPPAPPAPVPAQPPPAPVAPTEIAPNLVRTIASVSLVGVTAYSDADLAPYIANLTGQAVPLQRIERARTVLLTRYRRDGYIYTTVRARISGTALTFVVLEPHITEVKLSQDIGPAGALVLRFLNHLADGRLLRDSELQRWVLLANDIPGVAVRVILDPSTTDPGALTLRAVVTRQAVSGSLRADNRAFQLTGPQELLALTDFNSFTSLGERTELSIYHTLNNTDNFGQASEEFFIGASGLKLRVYAGYGEAIPSGSLRELGYDGITRVFGAALSYPVIRSREHNLTLAAMFDGVESDISYSALGFNSRASFDSLRILRVDASDILNDIWLAPSMPGVTSSGITVSQGLPAFGASTNGNVLLPRLNERVDFTKVDARLDRTQTLFSPYTYNHAPATVQIEAAVEGQFTNNILPPEEEFYLGGPQFNRGFYYGEVTGDRALTAKIEPQLVTALPTLPVWNITPQATFYAFYDWGETWQQQQLDKDHRLRSIGGGMRLAVGNNLEVDLEGADRLTRTPSGPPPQGPLLKSAVFYWQVLGRF